MNTNSGKTGIINIPSALHSTGGDGDGHVGNVVAYTGDIFDDRMNKNQRTINKEFSDKFKKSLVLDDSNSIAIQTSSFYFTLSGNNSTYTTLLYGNDQYTNYFGGYVEKTFVGTDLLDYYGEKVATISGITFQNNQLVFNLDTNLGELNNEYFYANCPHGQNSFLYGCYASTGMYPVMLGQFNLNAGTSPKILGDNNCNSATSPSIVGNSNFINGEGAHVAILGDYNNVSGDSYMYVVGEGNNMYYTNNEFYGIGLNNNVYSQKLIAFNLGSNNTFQKGQNAGNGWINQFAFGHDLTITQDGFVIGTQNVNYDSSDSSIRNFFVVANSGNDLEIKHNGDMYIKGVGNFDGTNSSASTVQSLQEVVSGIQTSIAESTGGVDEFTVEQMIKSQSASINNMLHTINANSDRIKITLTGSGTSYSGSTGDEMKDRIFVAALSNYPSIYQTSSSEQELAAVRSASYNSNSQKFVLTLTDSLGNLNNADYYITAIAKPSSVCLGGYMQSGYFDNVIGSENFVKGNNTNVYGGHNTVSGDTVSVIGKVNIAVENSEILGNNNKILKNSCGIMGEFNEIPASAQTESYLIGSNNKIKGNFRGYSLGRYNTFQPQLASAETGVALGEYLTLFNGGVALGKYNFNDYVQSADKQSFFTVSNGQSKYSGKNLFDVKKDGSFYLYGCGGYEGQSTANPAIQTVQQILSGIPSEESVVELIKANGVGVDENNSSLCAQFEEREMPIHLSGSNCTYIAYVDDSFNREDNQLFGDIYNCELYRNVGDEWDVQLEDTGAVIMDAYFNDNTGYIELETDEDLGELNDETFYFKYKDSNDSTIAFGGFHAGGNGDHILLGFNNVAGGFGNIMLGRRNASASDSSILLGGNNNAYGSSGRIIGENNTTTKNNDTVIGTQNEVMRTYSTAIGYANYISGGTKSCTLIGEQNQVSQCNLGAYVIGHHNKVKQYADSGETTAYVMGEQLEVRNDCIALGKRNVVHDTSNTNKQVYFTVSYGTADYDGKNLLEQRKNGDFYVKGIGGFDGTNSDDNTIKTLQAVIDNLTQRIAALESQLNGNS